ncbi:LytR/AlgR family response regulator transcription factor [Candidatus Enterococcus palustris]|uniref:LytR/AlgR family response regulator transcription factor n=1 Tax=Candidatus Enterococcus palustris TaxID=1834189 RepID=UPI00201D5301|nr:response regulator [Enterococcus sp. 7F3_DIV0205]
MSIVDGVIRVYIIEDDFVFRKKTHDIVESLPLSDDYFSLEVIAVENFDSFFSTLNKLVILDNDIFLVDIDLQSYYSGIELAKEIRQKNKNCFILFLTNLEDKALEIINQDINAKSYIIKGTSLDTSIFESLFHSIKMEIIKRIQNKDNYISFKKFGEIIFIKYEDILYITSVSGMRGTLAVHTINSEQIVEGSISKLRKEITTPYLYTGLKSYIINLNQLQSLNRSIGLIIFNGGYELEVGLSIIDKLNKVL